MHSRIISTAIWVTRISLWLSVLVYALLIATVVYWHLSPDAFNNWYIAQPYQAGAANFRLQRLATPQGLTFNDMGAGMVYWLAIRTTFFFVLICLALQKVLHILQSVKSAKTFYQENIRHFRKLATIGALYTIIYSVNFGVAEGNTTLYFKLPFVPLLFTTACLVLSAIFEEGQRLREDANSII